MFLKRRNLVAQSVLFRVLPTLLTLSMLSACEGSSKKTKEEAAVPPSPALEPTEDAMEGAASAPETSTSPSDGSAGVISLTDWSTQAKVNGCSSITVSLKNTYGGDYSSTTATILSLVAEIASEDQSVLTQAGRFYSDASCGNQISDLSFGTEDQSYKTIYFKASDPQINKLTIKAESRPGWEPVTVTMVTVAQES